MSSSDFAKPKASYRKLYAFQKAEAIYDLTFFFLQERIPKTDRTYDQMLHAPVNKILWKVALIPLLLLKWKLNYLELREEACTSF